MKRNDKALKTDGSLHLIFGKDTLQNCVCTHVYMHTWAETNLDHDSGGLGPPRVRNVSELGQSLGVTLDELWIQG